MRQNQTAKRGDACTRYFHLQACHRRRKNYLFATNHNDQTFTEEEAKADIIFCYYNDLLGIGFIQEHRIDLPQLGLPQLDLADQVTPFSVAEVATVVKGTPSNHAPCPDGLNCSFYKAT
jgi:hypothetical protein